MVTRTNTHTNILHDSLPTSCNSIKQGDKRWQRLLFHCTNRCILGYVSV